MTSFVIGVDGGGSRTRVLIADETGLEIATAEGDGSAVRPGEADYSAQVIAATIHHALTQANLGRAGSRVACVGVAGVGRTDERESLTDALDVLEEDRLGHG